VLPYVAEVAVRDFAWLTQAQMIDGLGLAESTPGPLIMVVQFVGFLGGWNQPGGMAPLLAATLGALITTWCTFVPCFLWIFLGAPHIEQLREHRAMSAAMSTITASVVGVVLNLAVWFALAVLFPATNSPGVAKPTTADWFAVAVCLVCLAGLILFRWEVLWVVGGAAAVGLARSWWLGA
jgi:chromate transporter